MTGYLDSISPAQGCAVVLGAATHRVPRARLGVHLRLSGLADRVEKALARKDATAAAGAIVAYLAELDLGNVEGATGTQLLTAYLRLMQDNAVQWLLPFMKAPAPPRSKPLAYDYPDRVYAYWVHKLASRYGWTRDEILSLWPEELGCYLQEIMVAEYDETDARRVLSEMAYSYDKGSKKSRFHPLPRPGWMVGLLLSKPRRVHRDMLPMGVVVEIH